jgi:hypothetical protein
LGDVCVDTRSYFLRVLQGCVSSASISGASSSLRLPGCHSAAGFQPSFQSLTPQLLDLYAVWVVLKVPYRSSYRLFDNILATLGSSIRDLPRGLQALILPWASIFQSPCRVLPDLLLNMYPRLQQERLQLDISVIRPFDPWKRYLPKWRRQASFLAKHMPSIDSGVQASAKHISPSSAPRREDEAASRVFPNQNQDHIGSLGVRPLGSSTVLHTRVEMFHQMTLQ